MSVDAIDRALPAAAAPVPVVTFNFRFKSGLEAKLLIDARCTEPELLELTGTLGSHVPGKLDEFRNQGPQLLIARGSIPRP